MPQYLQIVDTKGPLSSPGHGTLTGVALFMILFVAVVVMVFVSLMIGDVWPDVLPDRNMKQQKTTTKVALAFGYILVFFAGLAALASVFRWVSWYTLMAIISLVFSSGGIVLLLAAVIKPLLYDEPEEPTPTPTASAA